MTDNSEEIQEESPVNDFDYEYEDDDASVAGPDERPRRGQAGGGPRGRRPGPQRGGGGPGGGPGGGGRGGFRRRRKVCSFCVDKVKVIDYKNLSSLRRFVDSHGKIQPSRKTGTCAKHQRRLTVAVKRARHLALIPFAASRTPYSD